MKMVSTKNEGEVSKRKVRRMKMVSTKNEGEVSKRKV